MSVNKSHGYKYRNKKLKEYPTENEDFEKHDLYSCSILAVLTHKFNFF